MPVLDGLGIRKRGVLGRLSAIADVQVVTYDEGYLPPALDRAVTAVSRVPHDPARPSGLGDRARYAMSGRGLFHDVPGFREALRRTNGDAPFDLVWIGSWAMLPYAALCRELFPRARIVADLADDVVRAREIERGKSGSIREQLALWREIVRFRDLERSALEHVDVALYVSEADAASTLRRNPGVRVETRPNGVDTAFFAPPDERTDAPVVAFEGTMDFAPNIEGAVHLVRDILPLVRAQVPGVEILLIGREPTPAVRALAGPGVTVTGTVDDVRAHLGRASVFACPLLGGVGQKNKILQAWSMGLPIVATPISTVGLTFEDGTDLVLARDTRAFAAAVVELLEDPARRDALARAGRANALRNYSTERRMDDVESLVRDLVRCRSGGGATGGCAADVAP